MKKTIVAAAVLLIAAVLLSSCSFNLFNNFNFSAFTDSEKYEVGNIEYSADAIKKIDIEWVFGNIMIIPSHSDKLTVTEIEDNLDDDMKMRTLIDEDTLKIKFCKSGFSASIFKSPDKRLSVEIPEGVSLTVSSVSGAIKLGMETDSIPAEAELFNLSEINLKTISGDIAVTSLLNKIKCDNATVSTVSGDVDVISLYCSEIDRDNNADSSIKVDSVSGNVRLAGNFNKNDVSTVSGNLTVE